MDVSFRKGSNISLSVVLQLKELWGQLAPIVVFVERWVCIDVWGSHNATWRKHCFHLVRITEFLKVVHETFPIHMDSIILFTNAFPNLWSYIVVCRWNSRSMVWQFSPSCWLFLLLWMYIFSSHLFSHPSI